MFISGNTWKLVHFLFGSTHIMETFPEKRFELYWYGETFLRICHYRLLSNPWPFKFHTCFDNPVSFIVSEKLCMVVTPCVNSTSEGPWYTKLLFDVEDIVLCARNGVRNSPFNGQFGFDLQLHLWVVLVIFVPKHFRTMFSDDVSDAFWWCFYYP